MKSLNTITFINICSTALLQGVVFISTPIFTRLLGTEQYGIYAVFNSWVSIFTCFMGLGSVSTIGTGMYQFKNNYYEFRSCVLLYGTLSSIVIFTVCILLINYISACLEYDKIMIFLLLTIAITHYFISYYQSTCIYEKKAVQNFLVSVILSLTSVGLSIFLIQQVPDENRYLARIYGVSIPYIIIGIVTWILVFKKYPIGLKKHYCTFAFVIGIPIVFNALAQNILSHSDRIMMQFMNVTDSDIGIYSLFYSLSMVLGTILTALNTSWCPFYYEDLDKQNWKKLNYKVKNYVELFSVLTIGFLLLAREVTYIMANNSYWSGMNIIPILVVAVYMMFMYQFPVNFEFFRKETKYVAIGTIGAGIINIILNAMMIPIWGIYGAAFATMLSYAMLFVFHNFLVKQMKEYQYNIDLLPFIRGFIAVLFGVAFFYILSYVWYIRWCLGILIGLYELVKIYKRKTIF